MAKTVVVGCVVVAVAVGMSYCVYSLLHTPISGRLWNTFCGSTFAVEESSVGLDACVRNADPVLPSVGVNTGTEIAKADLSSSLTFK